MDEVYLATSLVKYNYQELVSKPLLYQQKAPIGFLLLVKCFISVFGTKEMALRIVPLLSGILALFIFVPVTKFFLKKELSVLLAIGIFSFAPALIYHSVEIKQYSTELLGAVLSLYLYIKFKENHSLGSLLLWGMYGAAVLWFSYSAIFILGGIATGVTLAAIFEKKWKTVLLNTVPFAMWLTSFAVNYLIFTHKHAESSWIVYWFKAYDTFMPFPPKSLSELKWFVVSIYRMLDYPLGLLWSFAGFTNNQVVNTVLKMPLLPIFFLFYGASIFMKRSKLTSLVLVLPIILMFIASGLTLYPLTERFWVFISPIFILLIAFGFEFFTEKIRPKTIATILVILLLIGPMVQAVKSFLSPETFYIHKKSFQREALMYINENYKKDDGVYIYWNDLPGYRLYKEIYTLNYPAVEGIDVRKKSKNFADYFQNLQSDFKKTENKKRLWLVFNTSYLTDIGDKIDDPSWYYIKNTTPTTQLLNEFLKANTVLKKFETKDITVYLLKQKTKG